MKLRNRRRAPNGSCRIESLEWRRLLSGIDLSGGFADPTGLTLNGSAQVSGSRLRLTDAQAGFSTASTWSSSPQNVTRFSTQFRFRVTGPDAANFKDGFTFAIQGNGNTSRSPRNGLGLGFRDIPNSVGLKFDLLDAPDSTGLYTNGHRPYQDRLSFSMAPAGIDLHSTHVFTVTLDYDGTSLNQTVLDTSTNATFTHAYEVDIPAIVGSPTAFVGFTASAGPAFFQSASTTQEILSWTYEPPVAPSTAPPAPSGAAVTTVVAHQVDLAWQDNATDEDAYLVYRRSGAESGFRLIDTLPQDSTSFMDLTAASGTLHEYRVQAFNGAGGSGFATTSATTPIAAPTNVVARVVDVADVTEHAVEIRWDAANQATSYNLYRSTTSGSHSAVPYRSGLTGTSFVDDDAEMGTAYYYRLTTVSVQGETAASTEASSVHPGLVGTYFFMNSPTPDVGGDQLPPDDRTGIRRTDTAGPPMVFEPNDTDFARVETERGVFVDSSLDVFDTGLIGGSIRAAAVVGPNTGTTLDGAAAFGVRWQGTFTPPTTEAYTFAAHGDDEIRVWVNGQLVVDGWNAHDDTRAAPTIGQALSLVAGTAYPIRVDYISPRFSRGAGVLYQTPTLPLQHIPLAQLSDLVAPPAAPQNVRVTDLHYRTATLAWDVGSIDTTTYALEQSLDGVEFESVKVLSDPASLTTTLTRMRIDTTYHFRVRATNAAGHALSQTLTLTTPAPAPQPITDTAFGDNGLAKLLPAEHSLGSLVQPDGKLVVASYASANVNGSIETDEWYDVLRLTRFNPDGTLDATFGDGGHVNYTTFDFIGIEEFVNVGIAGGHLVAGPSGGFYLACRFGDLDPIGVFRFDAQGQWDQTFGDGAGMLRTGVKASVDLSDMRHDPLRALTVDSQGRLVVAGCELRSGDPLETDFAVERYLPDGTIDSSFGTDGRVITPFDEPYFGSAATAVTIDQDGRLVLVGFAGTLIPGFSENAFVRDFAIARYNADGTLDASFDADGRATTGFHADGYPYVDDAPFPNVHGSDIRPLLVPGPHFLHRVTYDGAVARSVVVDASGRIVVGGRQEDYLGQAIHTVANEPLFDVISSDFALVRYLPDGTLDPAFGAGGLMTTTPTVSGSALVPVESPEGLERGVAQGQVTDLAIDASGRIIAGGDFGAQFIQYGVTHAPIVATWIAVTRYDANGNLDLTFGASGRINSNFGGEAIRQNPQQTDASFDFLETLTLTADGNILLTGNSSGPPQRVVVTKYLTDPRVDAETIDADLQSKATLLQGANSSSAITYQAATTDQVDAFLDAVAALEVSTAGSAVYVTLDAAGNTFSGQTVSVPANVVLTINGATFVGASPALTITSGSVVLTDSTLINSTDAPMIRLLGGNLKLRGSTVVESDGYAQAAIDVASGSLDLGSATEPGNNTINVRGRGVVLSGAPAPAIDLAAGNAFQQDGVAAAGDRAVQGLSWVDFNNDGAVDLGEQGLGGLTITLSGTDFFGRAVQASAVTDASGLYAFASLWPGTYSIAKGASPAGYVDGKDVIGTLGGSNATANVFSGVTIGAAEDALAYNFASRPAAGSGVTKGQSAGIGFWANKKGQGLIVSCTNVGPWLARTLPNMFGPASGADSDLSAAAPQRVAELLAEQFAVHDKLEAQFMATALNVYATTASLGGATAAALGFGVSEHGLGYSTWHVGTDGAAFGVADGSTVAVLDLLQAADERAADGVLYGGNPAYRRMAQQVFGAINDGGQR